MTIRNFLRNAFPAVAVGVGLILSLSGRVVPADENPKDYEILTRGPVHEAFAEPVTFEPEPGLVIGRRPPELVEEIPPDQQLTGDNVTWIAGYWAWNDEQENFLWISGIWRNVPPGRQWVPGYWSEIDGGQFQWTSGYWADATASEVSYIPEPPPATLEAGANTPAPSEDHTWIPGNWLWTGQYSWRPGYWTPLRPDWTWVPSRYCWTRRGYVYVDGYWDYDIASRGVLFAPVHFHRPVYDVPDYYYTPSVVVDLDLFSDHLFVRPRYCHYYFGDYYDPHYLSSGFHVGFSWHSGHHGYDSIWAHERWRHRHDRGWDRRRRDDFAYYRDHRNARPPRTFAAMRDWRDDRSDRNRNRAFARTLTSVANDPAEGRRFRALERDRRDQLVAQGRQMREFRRGRQQLEAAGINSGEARATDAARERVGRSPVVGRRADRFANDEAPPPRPERRLSEADPSRRAGDREAPGIARGDNRREREAANGSTSRRAEPAPGVVTRDSDRSRRDGRSSADGGALDPPARGQAAPERRDPRRELARDLPDRRTGVDSQRRAPNRVAPRQDPATESGQSPANARTRPQSQTDSNDPRRARTVPQIDRGTPSKARVQPPAADTPRRESPRARERAAQPSATRSTPSSASRSSEARPQVRRSPDSTPSVRSSPQPVRPQSRSAAPQRSQSATPRQVAPRRPEATKQRQTQPRSTARTAPSRAPSVARRAPSPSLSQSQARPAPQRRSETAARPSPARRVQAAPQRQAQARSTSRPQARSAPQRQAQARSAPQRQAQARSTSRPQARSAPQRQAQARSAPRPQSRSSSRAVPQQSDEKKPKRSR